MTNDLFEEINNAVLDLQSADFHDMNALYGGSPASFSMKI